MRQLADFLGRHRALLLILAIALFCAACAHQPHPDASHPPGFFSGLIHGFTMLFSFLGSIFMDVRIYAYPNSGFYYDLGYVLGAGCFFGGLCRSR